MTIRKTMAFPTAPPHPLRISVAATLFALSLIAAPACAQAAEPVEPDARSARVLAQAPAQPAPAKPSAESSEDAAITATVRAWAQAWHVGRKRFMFSDDEVTAPH